jgi:hypothetical protein
MPLPTGRRDRHATRTSRRSFPSRRRSRCRPRTECRTHRPASRLGAAPRSGDPLVPAMRRSRMDHPLRCRTSRPCSCSRVGLPPTVSTTYGPPNVASASTWEWFTDTAHEQRVNVRARCRAVPLGTSQEERPGRRLLRHVEEEEPPVTRPGPPAPVVGAEHRPVVIELVGLGGRNICAAEGDRDRHDDGVGAPWRG